ncbi:MAG: hypothetical protein ACOZNI_12415 [Myxococcota bacterium]
MNPDHAEHVAPESWQDALTRRLRTLVRTRPFHRLEASKTQRGLEAHDLRALALRALDATIDRMGLGAGATRAEVREALTSMIRAVEPTADKARIAELADGVIDALLNEPERRRAFAEPYASVEGDLVRWRELPFHLLREEETPEGDVVLRVSAEGINLYVGMLEYELEDAQAAEDAVLRAQIRRGRIADAVATAEQARKLSIAYAERLARLLGAARRDITLVEVHEVLRLQAEARVHLGERLEGEADLLRMVEERLFRTEGPDGEALARLRAALKDCRDRHLRLFRRLQVANTTWLEEQERQAFRPRMLVPLPDLHAEVLRPALELSIGTLAPAVPAILAAFQAPRPPGVFHLALLVERLLAPRRQSDEVEPPLPPELETLDFDSRYFEAVEIEAVEALLVTAAAEVRLGELLDRARVAGMSERGRHLLVLRVARAFDPEPDGPPGHAEASGLLLCDPEYVGDDLLYLRGTAG